MFQKIQSKFLLISLVLPLLLLVACSNAQTSNKAWLEGSWHSKEWKVTYTFSEKNGIWTISDQGNPVAQNATIKTADEKELVLEDKDGTRFVIEKEGEKTLSFQQVVAEGLTGTTASVRFEKE